ncbi:MAG: antibiotic acetyltransferase, partial [Alphaproteobacteria bacterium]|nr:antibiotic acetyltransferase [Alphaproteobacteria bacterium]
AGAVVSKDVAPYSIVGGNPAQVLKYRFTEQEITSLLKLEWWHWPDEKIKENEELFYKEPKDLGNHF